MPGILILVAERNMGLDSGGISHSRSGKRTTSPNVREGIGFSRTATECSKSGKQDGAPRYSLRRALQAFVVSRS